MHVGNPLILSALALLAIYGVAVIGLVVSGRRSEATIVARFIPDCIILTKRLLQDDRVPRASKVALALLAAYLVLPIDLVPDFVPIAGQLDDAILVVLVFRHLIRSTDVDVIREHWPGQNGALDAILNRLGSRRSSSNPDFGHNGRDGQ